jgi:hypothetical protein
MEYFFKFFKLDFWTKEVPANRLEAFKLKRLVASACRIYADFQQRSVFDKDGLPPVYLLGKYFSVFPADLDESDWLASWKNQRKIAFKER